VDDRPTLIYLFRHGEVVLAERRRFVGHLDVPLSPRGEAQCLAQAARLRGVALAAVFTSDLSRAFRSGEIIGAPHGLVPKALPDLREMDMGRWDGLTSAELEASEPEAYRDWLTRIGEYPFPEGEDVPALVARAWPAFQAIADAHPGQAVAIVAHAGPNRAILCRALGIPLTRLIAFGQDYAALTVLRRARGHWRLLRLNERPAPDRRSQERNIDDSR
jgi:broad specificity phosphatase PhoE